MLEVGHKKSRRKNKRPSRNDVVNDNRVGDEEESNRRSGVKKGKSTAGGPRHTEKGTKKGRPTKGKITPRLNRR